MSAVERAVRDLALEPSAVRPIGRDVAKVPFSEVLRRERDGHPGRIVLVTGMTPTPRGEGKTVTAVGLAMALARRGRRAVVCLRQPSLGPVFGVKGGAAGGGRATVEPFQRINLGLTGDIAAVEAAQNLLAALVDNHVYQGNALGIDPNAIFWPRTVDANDRSLRRVYFGSPRESTGPARSGRFLIAAASEVMAIHGLARDYADLRARLGRIAVARTASGGWVRSHDVRAEGAMAVLLRDAFEPNLVLTQEETPALVHGGPFGNIAHGTASLTSIRLARAVADIAVVEAGFGSDLGAEKFVDLVAPTGELEVASGVLVATARALRYHGGASLEASERPDVDRLRAGLPNLARHIENLRALAVEPVVALNRFPADADEELRAVEAFCDERNVAFAVSSAFSAGGEGALALAEHVEASVARPGRGRPLYAWSDPFERKLDAVVRNVYGGTGAQLEPNAVADLEAADELGVGALPICVSKTPFSLSDDPSRLGRPEGFAVRVGRIEVRPGAGYTVVHMGNVTTMPGLPPRPAAESIDLTAEGEIIGVR